MSKPCEMVVGWKCHDIRDETGRIVDVDRGDEIECGKPSALKDGGAHFCFVHARALYNEGDMLSRGATIAFEALRREVEKRPS